MVLEAPALVSTSPPLEKHKIGSETLTAPQGLGELNQTLWKSHVSSGVCLPVTSQKGQSALCCAQ